MFCHWDQKLTVFDIQIIVMLKNCMISISVTQVKVAPIISSITFNESENYEVDVVMGNR